VSAPAVFLDRDGVLVRARVVDGRPLAIHAVDELELEEGAESACHDLHAAGFRLVAITNQPEVARGTVSAEAVERIHEQLREALPLDAVYVCPHDDEDLCACRKPRPGMLFAAAEELDLDLDESFVVGDRWRDVEAGRRAGCITVFVDRDYSEPVSVRPDRTVRSVSEAAEWIRAKVRA
jgi:D-glycero-D-manno-heptose 1,7-bisphosphate phosphatase